MATEMNKELALELAGAWCLTLNEPRFSVLDEVEIQDALEEQWSHLFPQWELIQREAYIWRSGRRVDFLARDGEGNEIPVEVKGPKGRGRDNPIAQVVSYARGMNAPYGIVMATWPRPYIDEMVRWINLRITDLRTASGLRYLGVLGEWEEEAIRMVSQICAESKKRFLSRIPRTNELQEALSDLRWTEKQDWWNPRAQETWQSATGRAGWPENHTGTQNVRVWRREQ